ncbi:MAG: SPOR domain-containing protein [Bacteroidota bacterium]
MRIKMILIAFTIITVTGCKTQKLTKVEEQEVTKPDIENKTEVDVEVDHQAEIRTMEERFTFASSADESNREEHPYFVIIGSFRSKDNAENYTETLKNKGFEPVILLSETGFHRVSVDSYLQEQEARSRIYQIINDFPEHNDTWLLIRK